MTFVSPGNYAGPECRANILRIYNEYQVLILVPSGICYLVSADREFRMEDEPPMNWTFLFVVRRKQIFSGGGRPHLRPHAFSTAAVLREAHSQLTADKQRKQPQTSAHTGELAILQKQWRSCSE